MGSLIRTVLVLAIVLLVGAYLLGYLPQTATLFGSAPTISRPQSADELKDRASRAAQRVDEGLADTALTTKIKAKIALDDTLKNSDISVHTRDSIVTLSGDVRSSAAKARAAQLAHETAGVKSVVDQLKVADRE
jgi:hyperosmotically inducible protein